MEIFEFSLNWYNIELFEEHLENNDAVMPEFNRPSGNKDSLSVKLVFNSCKRNNIYITKKSRLRRVRWLVYQNLSYVERLVTNENLESCCQLCGVSIACTIYKECTKLLEEKKFQSIDQKNHLIEMISIIYGAYQMPNKQMYLLFTDTKPKPFDSKLSYYLKSYEKMYEGYCSYLCREIDFNWKTKNSYL